VFAVQLKEGAFGKMPGGGHFSTTREAPGQALSLATC
jgi:hypothetical protein